MLVKYILHGASLSAPTAHNWLIKQVLNDKCKATVRSDANVNQRLCVTAPLAGFVGETDTSRDVFPFIKAGEYRPNGVSTSH